MAATLWKGHLSFGLVSIPIKLVRAARAEKVQMHHLQRQTGSRVRQLLVPEAPVDAAPEEIAPVAARRLTVAPPPSGLPSSPTPAAVPKQDLVRGFEYEKNKYVAFEPEELEQIAPRNSTTMEILQFVKLAEVDPVYLENSYYAVPDKGGEKPYALLFEALRKTGNSAIAEFVMYRRDQTILLRAAQHGIIGHTLFHNDEVRRNEEFRVDSAMVKPAETELAIKLVEALAAPFEPEKFKDKYRERLQAAISEKIGTGAITEARATGRTAPVIDIVEALKASLNQARKPAARETASGNSKAAPAGKKKAGGRH
jgi:DNA end-binding protein Ku